MNSEVLRKILVAGAALAALSARATERSEDVIVSDGRFIKRRVTPKRIDPG